MNKNKKKKGFTLIELIAVIAILGILAAIVVPKVGNYTSKAEKAKHLTNAKTIAQAAEMYNTENTDTTLLITGSTTLDTVKTKLTAGTTKYLVTWPSPIRVKSGTGTTSADYTEAVAASTYQQLLDYITTPES